MTRLNRLCSEEGGDDIVFDKDEHVHERWAKLFEWVVRINSYPQSR